MELLRRLLHRDRITGQAARFIVVGVLNSVVDFGAFFILVHIPGMHESVAKGISYFLGICNSFLWNKYWTFSAAKSDRGWREFGVFLLVNLPPLLVNVVVFSLLGIWIDSGSNLVRLGKVFAAAIVAVVWNFLGSRYFVFRQTALKKNTEEESDE